MGKTSLVILGLVAATAVIEGVNLHAIANHPASGGDPTGAAFLMLAAWGSIPLVASVLLVISLARSGKAVPFVPIASALAIGAALSAVALAQYSHATPGFLMLGFLIQCVTLIVVKIKAGRNAI